jgi:hypothetical protein
MKYDRFMLRGGPLEIPGGGIKFLRQDFFFQSHVSAGLSKGKVCEFRPCVYIKTVIPLTLVEYER